MHGGGNTADGITFGGDGSVTERRRCEEGTNRTGKMIDEIRVGKTRKQARAQARSVDLDPIRASPYRPAALERPHIKA